MGKNQWTLSVPNRNPSPHRTPWKVLGTLWDRHYLSESSQYPSQVGPLRGLERLSKSYGDSSSIETK